MSKETKSCDTDGDTATGGGEDQNYSRSRDNEKSKATMKRRHKYGGILYKKYSKLKKRRGDEVEGGEVRIEENENAKRGPSLCIGNQGA